MQKKLLEFIKSIQKNNSLNSYDEASTKQAIILPILSFLGWDVFNRNEIFPEYPVGNKGLKIDYSLKYNNENKVFIEAKRVKEDLESESHQKQILNYSFQEGVKLAILTNGITWWFYLPLQEKSWKQRKFYTIEISEQNTEEIEQKFNEFLSKENVISGKAIENAINIYKSKQRKKDIEETIPKAWEKIVEEPDKGLVDLIAETTEKLCGYKPKMVEVNNFIKKKMVNRFDNEMGEIGKLEKNRSNIINKTIVRSSISNKTFWFVNVGDRGNTRNWQDCIKYGFLSAGQGEIYSRPLRRLRKGDKIFAYSNRGGNLGGYVGFGIVKDEAVMIKDFSVSSNKLLNNYLQCKNHLIRNLENPILADYAIGVNWINTFKREHGKFYKGIFAGRSVVCKLDNQIETINFLINEFNLSENRIIIPVKKSSIEYNLVLLSKQIRNLFPGYNMPFIFETDIGDIEVKITSAPKNTEIGEPLAGYYIKSVNRNELSNWFENHRKLKVGDNFIITIIKSMKKYKFEIEK